MPILSIMEKVSFHHEVLFFPPWWKETFSMLESKFLHGGKNKE